MLVAGGVSGAQAATNLSNIGVQMRAARNSAAAGAVNLGVGVSPQQALQASQPSIQNLAHAAQSVAQQMAAQQAAAAAALNATANVANGLAVGGLQVAPGISNNAGNTGNPALWVNANLPTQSVAGNGHVTVDVQQTAQKAVVTWQTMNVGKQTTLNFDQSGGNQSNGTNNWVVLNRVMDPSGVPSQILGDITAQGSVYVLNRNGVLFGAGSQVNVQSLVASSLNLFSNDLATSNSRFFTGGIGDLNPSNFATHSVLLTTDQLGAGDITIAPGATLTMGNQGLALIAAPNVTNGGAITAPAGQVALVAGIGVSYDYNFSSFAANDGSKPQGTNDNSTTMLRFANYGTLTDASGNDITPVGTLINDGSIVTPRGNITLLGGAVEQNGVAVATTSVAQPGSIVVSSLYEVGSNAGSLSPADESTYNFYTGAISFGPQSVTAILPDSNGAMLASDPTSLAPFQHTAPGGSFIAPLPTQGLGLIEIAGQAVDFQGGSLTYAPGQTITVNTAVLPDPRASVPPLPDAGRILLESGATLDVSGIANTELPMSSNLLTVILAGNELADDPLQQGGFLNDATVTVDMGMSGINPETGEPWVGTPVANLQSYKNLVQQSIGQLLVNGGTIELTANEVVGAAGSTINLMGGYVHYLAGTVQTTRLVDQAGLDISIGNANPNDTFVGIAGEFVESHPRWGVTKTWYNPLLNQSVFENDYVVGGNAGSLSIFIDDKAVVQFDGNTVANSGAVVFDSTVLAGDVAGARQVQSNQLPSGGSFLFEGILPIELAAAGALPPAATTPVDFTANAPLLATPGSVYAQANVFDSQALSAMDFASISLASGGSFATFQPFVEDTGAVLSVQPGGSIALQVGAATINGQMIARGGSISVVTNPNTSLGIPPSSVPGDIVVGPHAVLDVSGYFINDRDPTTQSLPDDLPINAGSISLMTSPGVSDPNQFGGEAAPGGVDLTGNITLDAGSLLNLQGGGHVNVKGMLETDSNGVPLGSGGSLTLVTYDAITLPLFTDSSPLARGLLTVDGQIDALGFNGGGTLTLQQHTLQIGGDPAAAAANDAYYFDPNQWGSLGFGSFVLHSLTSATVPDGTVVSLHHDNWLPNAAIIDAPNGADPGAYSTVGLLAPALRSPTNLTVIAGAEGQNDPAVPLDGTATVGAGAQLIGDPGAAISISGAMVDILGAIQAPGGVISLSVTGGAFNGGPLYLGPNSTLDVSGVVLIDPQTAPVRTKGGFVTPLTGEVLPGGVINLTDPGSSILAAPGAILNVSGAAGTFELPELNVGAASGSDSIVLSPRSEWSNAGSVNIQAATGLLFGATLIGHGGAPQAEGGTLTLTGSAPTFGTSSELVVVEDTAQTLSQMGATFNFSTYVPVASGSGQTVDPTIPPSFLLFGADSLNGSGFANLNLNETAGNVGFSGQVTLNLANSVVFNTPGILALNAANYDSGFGVNAPATGTALTVTAPYIAINGTSGSSDQFPTVTPNATNFGDATLTFDAGQIDLSAASQLEQISQATFNSTGAIRLLPSQVIINGDPLYGSLATLGNLTLNAAQIYPATDTLFVLEAVPAQTGLSTTIAFGYPQGVAASLAAPLSAGGMIAVSATNIVQDGNLVAPFGNIFLGLPAGHVVDGIDLGAGSRYAFVASQSVTLGTGSITSVSANGAIIPFGTTLDQTNWVYNPASSNPTWAGAIQIGGTQPITTNPLTQAPQGVITLSGASVDYQNGSTVNISGGGDLQAQEWVPGTGGSRDVLSQYNTSFANSTTGQQVPLYSDARQIYAIVPGFAGKVAPYDATMSQAGIPTGQQVYLDGGPGLAAGYYTLLPAKYATLPGAFRVVVNSGVVNPISNQTVVLPDGTLDMSGYFGNGLDGSRQSQISQFMVQPASTWTRYSQYALTSANTFFPQYASLNSLAAPYVPDDAGRLVLSATTGLTVNGQLDGAAGPGGFGGQVDISSQFIQIVGQGEAVTPGYLAISADSLDALGAASLLIGGTRTITAQGTVIKPTANGLIISNDSADPLTGPEILLTAAPEFQNTNIVLDNEGNVATVSTPVAGTGLVTIDSGSVIRATNTGVNTGVNTAGTTLIMGGSLSGLPVLPSSVDASSDNATTGDLTTAIGLYYGTLDATLGTLVQVSAGAPGTVQMPSAAQLSPGAISVNDNNVSQPGTPFTLVLPSLLGMGGGSGVVIDSGARIDGGNALTIATTGDTQIQSGAMLSAANVSALSSRITFVGANSNSNAGSATAGGMVIDANLLTMLEQSSNLNLQSYGTIAFQGDVNIQMTGSASTLTLGAGSLSSDGGQVSIVAPTLILNDTLNAAVPTTPSGGSGALTIDAGQLVFGAGAKSVDGFGTLDLSANQSILGQGTGSMNFGDQAVTLQTPALIADTASSQTLITTGALTLSSSGAAPAPGDMLGGAITLQGGSVTVSAPILAPAGNITLQAGTGDVVVTGAGALIAHGVSKMFGSTEEFASAGSINLTADHGTVDIQSGAIVDFAGAASGDGSGSGSSGSSGGNGGVLNISTGGATPVTIAGTLLGATATGATGSDFNLNSTSAVDLDTLTQILNTSGVKGGIDIETGQGDLSLSRNLNASHVSLVADGGDVNVTGSIVANGAATTTGEIDLYGAHGVDVEGSLTATGSPNSPKPGGLINIGVSGVGSTASLNSTYGYENVDPSASGIITIGKSAVIDASGGVVTFRAPILDAQNAQGANVNVDIAPGAQIRGGAVWLDAYAVWSTADQSSNPRQHFDGIVDPAGWYGSNGVLLAGAFTDASGNPVATWDGTTLVNDDGTTNGLSFYLANDYFMPSVDNTNHAVFYGGYDPNTETFNPASPDAGSLPAFVQQPGLQLANAFAGVANFTARPEIDLINPAPADGGVNGGNISVLTNWNLGAGVQNPDGSITLAYRYQGDIAPVLSLRASGNVRLEASISDGFFQTDSVQLPTGSPFGPLTYANALATYDSYVGSSNDESSLTSINLADGTTESLTGSDGQPLDPNLTLAAPQQGGSSDYYLGYLEYVTDLYRLVGSNNVGLSEFNELIPITPVTPSLAASRPAPPVASDPNYVGDYQTYLSNYALWLNNFTSDNVYTSGTAPAPAAPAASAQLQNPTLYQAYFTADRNYIFYGLGNLFDPNTFAAFAFVFAPAAPTLTPNIPVAVPAAANAPSNMGTPSDPLPLQFAALIAGQSTSYQFVAGATLGSANPLATANPATFATGAPGGLAGEGNVLIDGHTVLPQLNGSDAVIAAPTTVRTGTGSIDIAAAGDFELLDSIAPGVVYTAGTPVQPAAGGDGASIALGQGAFTPQFGNPVHSGVSTVLSSSVNPSGAGDITIQVGGDIIGMENVTDTLADPVTSGSAASGVANNPGAFVGQFWAPWLLANPANPSVAWYVNFGSFDQGVMSIGGNITVSARGDIRDLAVSTPTTGYLDSSNALHVTGGGNLSVTAGGSIYSGDFYVGQGAGSIKAGGVIASDFTYIDVSATYPVQTLLAVQYGTIDVSAPQSVDIGGVYDPTYLFSPGTSPIGSYQSYTDTTGTSLTPYFTTMSPDSGVSIQSAGGDLTFNSLAAQKGLFYSGAVATSASIQQFDGGAVVTSLLLPASLSLVALDGSIDIQHGGGLYPSATGSLAVVADQSIELGQPTISGRMEFGGFGSTLVAFDGAGNVSGISLGKLDDQVGTGILPTASDPQLVDASQLTPAQTRDPALVGPDATGTVLFYSLNGSLIDGTPALSGNFGAVGSTLGQISLIPNAPAEIFAGQSILDLPFYGENFNANDITSLIAGQDIRYNILGNTQPADIELAGPGTLLVQAGRNLDLQTQRVLDSPETGIRTLGNTVDTLANPDGLPLLPTLNPSTSLAPYSFGNPNLPQGGASVVALFGVSNGTDQAGFINQYINPANALAVMPSSAAALIGFVDQYEVNAGNAAAAPTTLDQAWAIFQTLPALRQQLLVDQVFFAILDTTGKDYNNPSSPFFQQYARGYQAINTLFPASLGYTANDLTGGANGANQLQATGEFDMRGSTVQTQQGGNIQILGPGGRILVGSADASPAVNPASEGILTLEQGNIDTFTDTNVLVAQSRLMTEQGGSIVMWSSNGNLDAGKGAKTSVSAPPPEYACDIDFVCSVDIKGEVSGAGIATLQSLPGVPVGDANLIAPRGTVDAGAAGIRVSGNLNVAALAIANVANIQVQGKSTGLPVVTTVDTGALTAAGSATSAVTQMAQNLVRSNASGVPQRHWIITVQVEGFGDSSNDDDQKKRRPRQVGYNPSSEVLVLGFGQTGDSQRAHLTPDEQARLGGI